jgi:SAM-dependent methyltransferase
MNTPVVLCIFNRPRTTRQVFEAIRRERPASLFVVADGPRPDRPEDAAACEEARRIATAVDWECEVRTNFAETNLGLARRMFTGISWAFEQTEQAIIVEDDCLPNSSFFRFCDEILDRYRGDSRLMAVSGDNYQYRNTCAPYSYYFSRYPHCWGWATWRRAWSLLDFEMGTWPEAKAAGWVREWFSDPASAEFWENIFDRVYRKETNSWAQRYIYACFLAGGLTALPAVNLVSNIGWGGEATNCIGISPRANLPTEELIWPLNHPPYMFRAREADRFTQESIYENRLPVRRVLVNSRSLLREPSSYDGGVNIHQAFETGGVPIPAWAAEMAGLDRDDALAAEMSGVNIYLNRARLAHFLAEYALDADLRDFVTLDVLACATGIPLSFTGELETAAALVRHPGTLWQHVWLYKVLGLRAGGCDVLDVGSPASHLTMLAAAAGNRVTSVHPEPRLLAVARRCAASTGVAAEFQQNDPRKLKGIAPESFDRILCCSVLEHLTAEGQQEAVAAMARVLKPGGAIGLTFDCGPAAPGATALLPPPHQPPASLEEARARYVASGLQIIGDTDPESPPAGSLYRDARLRHTVAALFLGKPPLPALDIPRPVHSSGSLIAAFEDPALAYRGYRMALEWERSTSRMFNRLERLEMDRIEYQAVAQERLVALLDTTRSLEAERQQSEIFRQAAEDRLKALLEVDAALRRERATREPS